MIREYEGNRVIGWKIISEKYRDTFEISVNSLMDQYDFVDFQFKVNNGMYYAAILLKEKET